MHGRGEQAVEEAALDVAGERDARCQPGEQRALDHRAGDDERRHRTPTSGNAAQALRRARAARDHREQHERQHERRHQQLRAAELHA